MYFITNPLYPLFHVNNIKDAYNGIKKLENVKYYSSDKVERIPKAELKEMIKKIIHDTNNKE